MAGSQLSRLASTDPAPIITSAAGRAQHIRVLEQNSKVNAASERGARRMRAGCRLRYLVLRPEIRMDSVITFTSLDRSCDHGDIQPVGIKTGNAQ